MRFIARLAEVLTSVGSLISQILYHERLGSHCLLSLYLLLVPIPSNVAVNHHQNYEFHEGRDH